MINNENILVTIRCITYNQEKYIRQTLEGFLMQKTNFKYEILIHDDASTDGTADIIREYEKKFPTYFHAIYQTENKFSTKGFKYITKLLIKEGRGKYAALCEGDDFWTDPYKLQKQVDFLESHPEFSMCFHQGKIHYEDNNLPDDIATPGLENREYTGLEIYKTFRPITCSVVMRTDVYKHDSYQKYLRSNISFGDLPTFLSCASCGKIYGMTDNMAVYRKHSGGLTAVLEKPDERILEFAKGHIIIYKLFGHQYKDQAISIYVIEHINFILMSYHNGKYRVDLLTKLLVTHPIYTIKLLKQRMKYYLEGKKQ